MRKLRRSVERNQRKKVVGKAAVAMIAATLALTGVPQNVYADLGGYSDSNLPASYASAQTINISEVSPVDGVINISLNGGSYILTGSNYISDAYVDVHIVVGSDVDLYLDDLQIFNEQSLDDSQYSTTYGHTDGIVPFQIDANANVYILTPSSVYAPDRMFVVSGNLNFMPNSNNAELTVGLSKTLRRLMAEDIVEGSGKIHAKGGIVNWTDCTQGGEHYSSGTTYFPTTIVWESEGFSFSEGIRFSTIVINDFFSQGTFPTNCAILYKDGTELESTTIEGLPPGSSLVQINDYLIPETLVGEDGSITGYFPREALDVYVKDGTSILYQQLFSTWYSDRAETYYQVTFLDADTDGYPEIKHYYAKSGAPISLLPEEPGYNTTYSTSLEEDVPVTAATTVSSNMTVYVSKSPKERIYFTLDDVSKGVDNGTTLAQAGISKPCVDLNSKTIILDNSTQITESMNLHILNYVSPVTQSGETWYALGSAQAVEEFAKVVSVYGLKDIKGYLTADVELGNDYTMIGNKENSYCGTFDGKGHTVTLNLNKQQENVGFFGVISNGAEIKNVNTAGSVTGNYYVGALVGNVAENPGRAAYISRCVNNASVTGSYGAGGIVGIKADESGIATGNMALMMDCSANYGTVTANATGGLIGYCYDISRSVFSNCYNLADCDLIGNGNRNYTIRNCYSKKDSDDQLIIDESAIASGELTYLLNQNLTEPVWFQTVGTGYPVLNADRATQTVYAGYENCESTSISYANSAFSLTTPGHKISEDACSSHDGKIEATCLNCSDLITADIHSDTEQFGGTLNGVTVTYSSKWESGSNPTITIWYASEKDGEYTNEKPSTVGEWFLKAYVGNSTTGIELDETYTIKEKPISPSIIPEEPTGNNEEEPSFTPIINQVIPAPVVVRRVTPVTPFTNEIRNVVNDSTKEESSKKTDTGAASKTGKDGSKGSKDNNAAKTDFSENTLIGEEEENAHGNLQLTSESVVELLGDDIEFSFADQPFEQYKPLEKRLFSFVDSSGNKITNSFAKKSSKLFYLDANGDPVKNELICDGQDLYYFGWNGVLVKNKVITLSNGRRMLAGKDGKIILLSNSIVELKGKKYLTKENGLLACMEIVTAQDGKQYYANKKGVVVTKKTVTFNGIKYRADKTGVVTPKN